MPHPTRLLPVLALAAAAVAQVGWTPLNPAVRPPARVGHSTTFDVVRGVTVLFGGSVGMLQLADTWEWNGVNWTQRVTSPTPPARSGNAFAFDIGRARAVLFGGLDISNTDLNDTWEFDGNTWMQVHSATAPSPRREVRMEYDAAHGRIVLFGGRPGLGLPSAFNDTWAWDGVAWTPRTLAMSPPARWGHGMTYDFARARVVMFGGAGGPLMNDTWTWNGTNWLQLPGAAPTAAYGFGLAYDVARDLVVRFGGANVAPDTLLFDNVEWRSDTRSPNPYFNAWCSLTHDVLRGRTVLFGGLGLISNLDDTWEYDPGTIARWTTSGSGCPGTAGVPTLRPIAGSLPIVGATFPLELLAVPGSGAAISYGFSNTQWNGGALPFDLGALGMTGCTLHASPDVVFFAPVVANRATHAWTLPNAPSLIGVRFFNQGFVLDPAVNPTGATVSNAGAGTIGPF